MNFPILSVNQGLQSPGVLASAVLPPGRTECSWGPLSQGTLTPECQRPIAVSTNSKQSWRSAGPWAQENQPHTNSHHGGSREGENVLKTNPAERKASGEAGSTPAGSHRGVWETKPEKEKLPLTRQERSPSLLTWLENTDKGQELRVSWEGRWL